MDKYQNLAQKLNGKWMLI